MLPELIGVPLVALLVWLVVGWSLRPLERMAQRLRARHATDLAPLVLDRLPDELEPVAASLNRLLANVTELLEREKRFLSHAAHELRTPLAVLRVQADNAVHATDPADREAALRQLDRSVSRATRLVEQLLAFARLEPGAADLKRMPSDLLAVVRKEIAELSPLALDRGLEIMLQAEESADHRVAVDEHAMQILLQNLISNAVRHSPPAGRVQVRLVAGTDAVEIHVEDGGPGVPTELRERVFERFFSEGPGRGAGLGLAIVARIVELHEGKVELRESPLGGLDAVVTLRRAAR
jgi:two-component system sensor histidine kinase QseC